MPESMTVTAATAGALLVCMAAVALVETLVPLQPVARRGHLRANLALTVLTLATNGLLNAGLVGALIWLEPRQLGLLSALTLPPLVSFALVVLALDFSAWGVHLGMHRVAFFWRFHRVHHSDRPVDVTTSLRQHPGESVLRYLAMGAAAVLVGASPVAFALYRAWSALHALAEHANVRLPAGVDRLLSGVVVTPNLHKVHHSREQARSETNFGSIFALFDRLFGTFTASRYGVDVDYGLAGFDDATSQTTLGLLRLPFRRAGAEPQPEERLMRSRCGSPAVGCSAGSSAD